MSATAVIAYVVGTACVLVGIKCRPTRCRCGHECGTRAGLHAHIHHTHQDN